MTKYVPKNRGEEKKTGWPQPALMQDDNRMLFLWFSQRMNARQAVRDNCERIIAERSNVRL